jgi:FKBP-type peptidyl-prolyl cis-trans isomerase 2
VVVDVNHPLAGKDLTFDINVVNVEKAPPPAPKPAK